MRFGKIDYLNLLPFDIFIKGYPTPSTFKQFLNHRKTYPARLNKDFLLRRIDAGFISSIAGYASWRKKQVTPCAIIGNKKVLSVLVVLKEAGFDTQSATSNALCLVLGIKGQVLIGDKALRFYHQPQPKPDFVDLASLWYERTQLPFVFGRFCYQAHGAFYQQMAKAFYKRSMKIPHYILEQRAKQSGLNRAQILHYLKHILYRVHPKEEFSLRCFYRQVRLKRAPRPRRF
ncbi:MqnA/MqnD/SBP family protein [Helicobacter heilmannii]|nr:MqnA/MqnD/SBP family protein [Helicobacter heilmannii]CRF46628.1 Menaquinone via 6-amino-6-deoxyfutalosine step 1 [Helicobacter heilmannii]CRF48435.1 Menaquinone via 6-amino-6-deoxyfutalosine step 1 [Helicobacter heilmannii]CRF49346.1 Menaquinone via 6-amino-6-deoxyfutalosine step 1 [Helicobacter heilmannii]CRF51544.1 Menaquinone via 6-amino-6-deoxyfutalosine step 1 [Helicobacter heilmannii]BDQ26654.1 chorismate dehydratase [Helicobacter heilmannii]